MKKLYSAFETNFITNIKLQLDFIGKYEIVKLTATVLVTKIYFKMKNVIFID